MSTLDEKKAYLLKAYKLKPNDTRSKEYCSEYNDKIKQEIIKRLVTLVQKIFYKNIQVNLKYGQVEKL